MFMFPPRRMREKAAAYYVGVSHTQFRTKVDSGAYPSSRREGGMVFWLKDDLDKMIDRQFGVRNAANSNIPVEEPDELAAALYQRY